MRVNEALFIIFMVGTHSRAFKLLKTPRIYNALITSDEKLLPSQAYPAISPVVQGIQYHVPGYVSAPSIYRPYIPISTFNSAATATAGRSFSYAVKQDYFSYNYFQNDATFSPKLPFPAIPDPNQRALFAPSAGLQPLSKEQLPYPSSKSRADSKKTSYEYQDDQEGNNGNEGQNRDDYTNFSAAAAPKKSHPQRGGHGGLQTHNRLPQKRPPYTDTYYERNYNSDMYNSADDFTKSEAKEETDNGVHYIPVAAVPFVTNHQPNDPSVVDIPPEPLPGLSKGKKKKLDHYPPHPLGLVLR